MAYMQRGAKRHPGLGLIGEVISPFSGIRFAGRSMLMDGIALSSAYV